jgi:hypothetical protein
MVEDALLLELYGSASDEILRVTANQARAIDPDRARGYPVIDADQVLDIFAIIEERAAKDKRPAQFG